VVIWFLVLGFIRAIRAIRDPFSFFSFSSFDKVRDKVRDKVYFLLIRAIRLPVARLHLARPAVAPYHRFRSMLLGHGVHRMLTFFLLPQNPVGFEIMRQPFAAW
jgi:hypothetical protein